MPLFRADMSTRCEIASGWTLALKREQRVLVEKSMTSRVSYNNMIVIFLLRKKAGPNGL